MNIMKKDIEAFLFSFTNTYPIIPLESVDNIRHNSHPTHLI